MADRCHGMESASELHDGKQVSARQCCTMELTCKQDLRDGNDSCTDSHAKGSRFIESKGYGWVDCKFVEYVLYTRWAWYRAESGEVVLAIRRCGSDEASPVARASLPARTKEQTQTHTRDLFFFFKKKKKEETRSCRNARRVSRAPL